MSEETIFVAALEKSPAERAAYLDEACARDPELRARVAALLQQHEEAGSFLTTPAADPTTGPYTPDPDAALSEEAGARLGPYTLLEKLGEGGMGSVWLAEQQQPVRRRVALKII